MKPKKPLLDHALWLAVLCTSCLAQQLCQVDVLLAADNNWNAYVNNVTFLGPDDLTVVQNITTIVPANKSFLAAFQAIDEGVVAGFIASIFVNGQLAAATSENFYWRALYSQTPAAGWNSSLSFNDSAWSTVTLASGICPENPAWVDSGAAVRLGTSDAKWLWGPQCSDSSNINYYRIKVDLTPYCNTTTPAFSVGTPANWQCIAGYGYDGASSCTACVNSYKTTTGKVACSACPAGATCAGTTVQCSAGYWLSADGLSCNACAAGTFKTTVGNGTCSSCLTAAYSTCTASTFTCSAGYTPAADGLSCVPCSAGSYKSAAGNELCTACDVGATTTVNGSITASGCLCQTGYGWNGTACGACTANTYKSTVNNTACTACISSSICTASSSLCSAGNTLSGDGLSCVACPVGSYKIAVGNAACTLCNFGATTATNGSIVPSKCLCQPGNGWNGTACAVCAANTYKSTLKNSACVACPSDSLCTASGFSCNAGFTLSSDGLSCVQCSAGSFKPAVGNGLCTQCGAGFTTAAAAATSASSCLCQPGFGWTGTGCDSCAANTYQSGVNNTACLPCPANSVCAAPGFSCYAGYTLAADGRSCVQCSAGSYKTAGGNGQCTACSSGTTTAINGSVSVSDCMCAPGYGWNGTTCGACSTYSYKSSVNNTACTQCPANSICTPSSFSCDAGYTVSADGQSCVACAAGTFKTAAGNGVCTACNATTTTANNGSVTASDCMCQPGHGWDGASCTPCTANTYKSSVSYTACLACPSNSTCTSASFSCFPGYTASADQLSCLQCPIGTYKSLSGTQTCTACPLGASTASIGNTLASSCICTDGYGWNGTDCAACSTNAFKSGLSYASCTTCPPNAVCDGISYQCAAGYYYSATVKACVACAQGSYKAPAGNGTCTSCAPGMTTAYNASTRVENCGCPPGTTWDGTKCLACPIGTFKSTIGNGLCSSCGAGSTTLSNGTTSFASCVCQTAYEWDGVQCKRCADGKYKAVVGDSNCMQCPDNAISLGESCACNPAYTLPANGTQCTPCASGYFKLSSGNEECEPCPAGSAEPQCTADNGGLQQSRTGAGADLSSFTSLIVIIAGAVAFAGLVGCAARKIHRRRSRKQTKSATVDDDGQINVVETFSKSDLLTNSQLSGSYTSNTVMLIGNSTEFSIPGYLQFQAGRDFSWEVMLSKSDGGEVHLGHGFSPELCKNNSNALVVKIVGFSREAVSIQCSQAFNQEMAVMRYLGSHRQIAHLLGWCEKPLALLLKHYQLGNLASFIQSGYLATKSQVVLFARDICDATQFMHNKCVAHRDICVENIFVDVDHDGGAVCVIGDFGAALVYSKKGKLREGFDARKATAINPVYSAPEVLRRFHGKGRDSATMVQAFQADVYAVAMLFFLLGNKFPPWN